MSDDAELERISNPDWQLSLLPTDHHERVAALVHDLQQAPDVKVGSQAILAVRSDLGLQFDYAQMVVTEAVEEYFRQLLHDATGFQASLHGPRVGVYLLAAKVHGNPTPDQL